MTFDDKPTQTENIVATGMQASNTFQVHHQLHFLPSVNFVGFNREIGDI